MFETLIDNLSHPPVLFFFLGMIGVLLKSNLEIPPQISKFLALYLLFNIGLKGGEELFHSGFSPMMGKVLLTCIAVSFFVPFLVYRILRRRLDIKNAGAIAATYGSISAVTFATAVSFLESIDVAFSGFMVAGMALMESPAIVSGLILIALYSKKALKIKHSIDWKQILHESFLNGSVYLLIGSLIIGILGGAEGEKELAPFIDDIFAGMLSLYMLDMGLKAGERLSSFKASGPFLIGFALLYPLGGATLGIVLAFALGLSPGNALLMTTLIASASYIAVPAAMRISVPETNMSLLLPMSLGITFTFNVTLGIPLYYQAILAFWEPAY